MNQFEHALAEVAWFLEGKRIPYMVIGGVANLFWGTPRATIDIDVTIWADKPDFEATIKEITAEFRALPKNPVAFVKQTRVLPVKTSEGIRADFIFGQLPYEKEAIDRARVHTIGGISVRICSPEDLIIHKIISQRPRDREDVKGIISITGHELDRRFLDSFIQGLASDLERPDILSFYESCWSQPSEEAP